MNLLLSGANQRRLRNLSDGGLFLTPQTLGTSVTAKVRHFVWHVCYTAQQAVSLTVPIDKANVTLLHNRALLLASLVAGSVSAKDLVLTFRLLLSS